MEIAIIIIFAIGYLAIAFEHPIKINKAASALLTGVLCWTVYVFSQTDKELVSHTLIEHLGEISGILFFLLGAMTIVELIDAHDGFQIITDRIRTKSTVKLIWIIGTISFFLSAALDNLTTTIVMRPYRVCTRCSNTRRTATSGNFSPMPRERAAAV